MENNVKIYLWSASVQTQLLCIQLFFLKAPHVFPTLIVNNMLYFLKNKAHLLETYGLSVTVSRVMTEQWLTSCWKKRRGNRHWWLRVHQSWTTATARVLSSLFLNKLAVNVMLDGALIHTASTLTSTLSVSWQMLQIMLKNTPPGRWWKPLLTADSS